MSFSAYITLIGLVLGVMGAIGIAFGQLRRGVVEELRASLSTAKTEIDIEKGRSDRLEQEATLLRMEVEKLRIEVTALRMVRVDEAKLAAAIAAVLAGETARLASTLAVETARQTQEVLIAIKESHA